MADAPIVITGDENINAVRLITIRSALKLETQGLKRHGRPARVIANEIMGTDYRTARKTYDAFNTWLVANYGLENRPL